MATVDSNTPMLTIGLAQQDFADMESTSICPLLTPSPSEIKLLSTSPDFLPDEESASTCPLLSSPPTNHPLEPVTESEMGFQENLRANIPLDLLESSASSSSSANQNNANCIQLLNHYQHLNTDKKNEINYFITQENAVNPILDLNGRKLAPDYFFINWNWPLLRLSCFWTVASITICCFCIVVGIVANVPNKCYPSHEWYQGGAFYEIFPASFQDTDHDGIGDLRGIAWRSEYFQNLGVSAVHLNSIFSAKTYPEEFEDIDNLTSIDKHIGNINDFIQLVQVLHNVNISIIIDLPIYPVVQNLGQRKAAKKVEIAEKIVNTVHNHRSHRDVTINETEEEPIAMPVKDDLVLAPYIDGGIAGLMKVNSEHLRTISRTIIEDAIHFWFELGVDGIFVKGLTRYVNDPHLATELESWRKIKNQYGGPRKKILMTDYSFLTATTNDSLVQKQILNTFDLLDVYVSISNETTSQLSTILDGPTFKTHQPWIHWNIGNVATERLSASVSNNLGAICFEFLLPGTISIFYGDELGLSATVDWFREHIDTRHRHHLSPMVWHPNKFTATSVMPWMPYGSSDLDFYESLGVLSNITSLRATTPSIYMKAIRKEEEVIMNTNLRTPKGLLIMERSYPRRNTFIAIYNRGQDTTNFDLSSIYYSGTLVASSVKASLDHIVFNELYIPAGATYIVKLDK